MSNIITFTGIGDFEASRAAEKWLRDRNFSYGPSQADGPQAAWHGDCTVSKWRNLSRAEQRDAHATITSSRNGPAKITLRQDAPLTVIIAFTMLAEDMEILRFMLGATPHYFSDEWGFRNHYHCYRRDIESMQRLLRDGLIECAGSVGICTKFRATARGCRVAGLDDGGVDAALKAGALAVSS